MVLVGAVCGWSESEVAAICSKRTIRVCLYSAMRYGEVFVLDVRPRVSNFRVSSVFPFPSVYFQLLVPHFLPFFHAIH